MKNIALYTDFSNRHGGLEFKLEVSPDTFWPVCRNHLEQKKIFGGGHIQCIENPATWSDCCTNMNELGHKIWLHDWSVNAKTTVRSEQYPRHGIWDCARMAWCVLRDGLGAQTRIVFSLNYVTPPVLRVAYTVIDTICSLYPEATTQLSDPDLDNLVGYWAPDKATLTWWNEHVEERKANELNHKVLHQAEQMADTRPAIIDQCNRLLEENQSKATGAGATHEDWQKCIKHHEPERDNQLFGKTWEQIDDINWDRRALELWSMGKTGREIADKLRQDGTPVAPKTVHNRLSHLRQIHGEDVVPKSKRK